MKSPIAFVEDARVRLGAAVVSLVVAAVLLGAKYAAYRLTGSTAILSDALESIVNVVAAVFALLSGLLIWLQLRFRARENALPLSSLMLGGSLYVVFIAYVLWSVLG